MKKVCLNCKYFMNNCEQIEMYSGVFPALAFAADFSASCPRISSMYAPRTPHRNLGTTDKNLLAKSSTKDSEST